VGLACVVESNARVGRRSTQCVATSMNKYHCPLPVNGLRKKSSPTGEVSRNCSLRSDSQGLFYPQAWGHATATGDFGSRRHGTMRPVARTFRQNGHHLDEARGRRPVPRSGHCAAATAADLTACGAAPCGTSCYSRIGASVSCPVFCHRSGAIAKPRLGRAVTGR